MLRTFELDGHSVGFALLVPVEAARLGRWDRALRRKGFDSTPVGGVDARRVEFTAEGVDDAFGGYCTKIPAR